MKGISEDVPATLFVVLLLVVFILSVLHTHGNYFGSVNFIQQKRIASSVAENISLMTKVVDMDPQTFVDQFKDKLGIVVELNNTDPPSKIYPSGDKNSFTKTAAVSSAALLIRDIDDGEFHPARVDVYVGE